MGVAVIGFSDDDSDDMRSRHSGGCKVRIESNKRYKEDRKGLSSWWCRISEGIKVEVEIEIEIG